jgi:hypothetical protein
MFIFTADEMEDLLNDYRAVLEEGDFITDFSSEYFESSEDWGGSGSVEEYEDSAGGQIKEGNGNKGGINEMLNTVDEKFKNLLTKWDEESEMQRKKLVAEIDGKKETADNVEMEQNRSKHGNIFSSLCTTVHNFFRTSSSLKS